MTKEGWYEALREAHWRLEDSADRSLLDLLAQLLAEQDEAKSRLQQLGIGCVGRPWLQVVDDIEEVLNLRKAG